MGSKTNPLTARVAINDMWMRHFGKPLVATVFNFGAGSTTCASGHRDGPVVVSADQPVLVAHRVVYGRSFNN